MTDFLTDLYKLILKRKKELPQGSYTASLFKKGKDEILKKVEEESKELIAAAKNRKQREIIHESADLMFHLLLLLAYFNISLKEVIQELKIRNKKSQPADHI